ncbi:MAG TPA: pyridoxamine 5'-phosphate oxidase family protein [Anaerolineae bacterium]|nr:pyridoxamine 5'-phosphate oxidase family protein [Anaerolineae bacterium]
MNDLAEVAPAFVDMAHRIVWSSAATVDAQGRPRSRILHPIWQWDGRQLIGWIGTSPTPTKRTHLAASPYISVNYWSPAHDTCVADCHAALLADDETRTMVWNLFVNAPSPVGYNPAIIPAWGSPTSPTFAVLRLEPWHLRVFPGSVLLGQGGTVLTWRKQSAKSNEEIEHVL